MRNNHGSICKLTGFVLGLMLTAAAYADVSLTGELPNGLRYDVQHNEQPAGKVELHLLVKAGSLDEADDEKGIAHLVEHMAFRRSAHFGEGEMLRFMEQNGVRIGADANAFTGEDFTIYDLPLPADPAVLDRGLVLMSDRAFDLRFDAQELATERKVVADEGRQRGDQFKAVYNAFFPDRHYGWHLPLGDANTVATLPQARIEAFYHRNYQPQRMTLVVVGDVDAAATVARIKALFGQAPRGDLPREHPQHSTTQYPALFLFPYSWFAHDTVGLGWVRTAPTQPTLIEDIQGEIARQLLKQRLEQSARKPDSPLASVTEEFNCNALPGLSPLGGVYGTLHDDDVKGALLQMLNQINRLQTVPVSTTELDSAKAVVRQRQLRWQQQGATNTEIAWGFLSFERCGMPVASPTGHVQAFEAASAGLTPATTQQWMQDNMPLSRVVAGVFLPVEASKRPTHFDDATLTNALANVTQKHAEVAQDDPVEVTPVSGSTKAPPAETAMPVSPPVGLQPGQLVSTEQTAVGPIWHFANGAQVLAIARQKPYEKVGVAAIAPGGFLVLDKAGRKTIPLLMNYWFNAGYADQTYADLANTVRDHGLEMHTVQDMDQHGLAGQASADQIEPLLQIFHGMITAPRDDRNALQNALAEAQQQRQGNIATLLSLAVEAQIYGDALPMPDGNHDDRFKDLTLADLAHARDTLLANPAAFRFVVTGVGDKAAMQTLMARYVGSLPNTGKTWPAVEALPISIPDKPIKISGYNESVTRLQITVAVPPQSVDYVLLPAIAETAKTHLFHAIRDHDGSSYAVWDDVWSSAHSGLNVVLQYTSDTDRCDITLQHARAELAGLQSQAPDAATLSQIKASVRTQLKGRPDHPMQYAQEMAWHWLFGDLAQATPDVDKWVTADQITPRLQKWLAPRQMAVGMAGCHWWQND